MSYFQVMIGGKICRILRIGRAVVSRGSRPLIVSVILFLTTRWSFGTPLIPTKQGTTWDYKLTHEIGDTVKPTDAKADADKLVPSSVVYRIAGMKEIDGKQLLIFEMDRAGAVMNTDLITVDARGILCWGRINLDGTALEFDPPQTIIAASLQPGDTWDFDSEVDNFKVHQHYLVVGEEDVDVPAGTFRALHIHGEQKSPNLTTIDRWFVPGTGIVKEITTKRSSQGDLMDRTTLELKGAPKIGPRPSMVGTPPNLSADLADTAIGESASVISADAPKIYARWKGYRLRPQSKVRVVWIAEGVDEVPPNFKVDEASAVAAAPDSHGMFTLERPAGGWVPGDYRAEFYVDGVLEQTVKLTIRK